MQIINEIFEIIGLLLSITAHKTSQMIEKIKEKGVQYLRILKWLIASAIIIPLICGALGVILKEHWLIGVAGIFLAVATLVFVSLTNPLIAFVETIFNFFKKDKRNDAHTLAKRFVNRVNTWLIAELMVTLYFVLIPWEQNPGLIVPVIIAIFIIGILAFQNWSRISGLIRVSAFLIAACVLIISTLGFLFPKTMGEMQKSIPAIDEKMQKDIQEGVSSLSQEKPKATAVIETSSEDSSANKPAQASKPVQDTISIVDAFVEGFKKPFQWIFGKRSEKEKGWEYFSVPGDVADAVPTNIHVDRGDSIDFSAKGEVAITFVVFSKYDDKVIKEGSVTPEGKWPNWMTPDAYKDLFIEHESNTCWNAIFRIGSDRNTTYYPIGTQSTHIAKQDGIIWLTFNDNRGNVCRTGYSDVFKGQFDIAVRVRPVSKAYRDSLLRVFQDSVLHAEQRRSDSIITVEREYQNMVRKDSIQGWTTIRFPLSVPEAMPTNVQVFPGDSIEIEARGSAMCKIWRCRIDGITSGDDNGELHALSPEGIWPIWMTADFYGKHFAENQSRKCWNLVMRYGSNANAPTLHVGENAAYRVEKEGDIWLKINRMHSLIVSHDSLSGEYIVKIRVHKTSEWRTPLDTNVMIPIDSDKLRDTTLLLERLRLMMPYKFPDSNPNKP